MFEKYKAKKAADELIAYADEGNYELAEQKMSEESFQILALQSADLVIETTQQQYDFLSGIYSQYLGEKYAEYALSVQNKGDTINSYVSLMQQQLEKIPNDDPDLVDRMNKIISNSTDNLIRVLDQMDGQKKGGFFRR